MYVMVYVDVITITESSSTYLACAFSSVKPYLMEFEETIVCGSLNVRST